MTNTSRAKILLVTATLAALSPATAATPEETYLAARDAAIARMKAAEDAEPKNPTSADDNKLLAQNTLELTGLDRQLRAIVGPVTIKGLEGKSAINLDTLFHDDEDFGLLDGMVFGAVDAKTRVIVTTDALLRHWLAEHKNWWDKDSPPLPQDPAAAVRDNDFYTQAVMTDSAIVHFADLAIRPPGKAALAYAMLASRTQDAMPSKADEIFVTMMQGGRVFIAYTKDFRAIGPIPACETIRRDLAKKATDAAQRPGSSQDQVDTLSARSDAEFLRCFAEKAPQQPDFPAAVKAAQALLDRLP